MLCKQVEEKDEERERNESVSTSAVCNKSDEEEEVGVCECVTYYGLEDHVLDSSSSAITLRERAQSL